MLLEVLAGLAALVTIWAFLDDRPAPADVVICEVVVKGPGIDPSGERITLCNHGPWAVELGGWVLDDGEGRYTLPRGAGILPGGEWSVAGAVFNPRGDRRGLFLNDTGDVVRLRDPTGRVIDECGWPPRASTATCEKSWH